MHAVEHKEWPVGRNFTAYPEECSVPTHHVTGSSQTQGGIDEVLRNTYSEPSEVITITTDHGLKGSSSLPAKRKRHIAIDVETERGIFHL